MFWMLRRTRLTDTAVSFFNAINNNGSTGGGKYDKLCCSDDNEDEDEGPERGYGESLGQRLLDNENNCTHHHNNHHHPTVNTILESDSSSCSELELEEELSQDSDYGELASDSSYYKSANKENLTCNVCDRFFCNRHQLSQHQRKKRHFGCSSCDSLFSSLMALEHHKEEFEHWSAGDDEDEDEDDEEDNSKGKNGSGNGGSKVITDRRYSNHETDTLLLL